MAADPACQQTLSDIQKSLRNNYGQYHASILIEQGDEELVSENFGSGINPHTRFLLGSVTKSLHAAVAVRLINDGLLHLEDTLGSRLPPQLASPLPQAWLAVKIRNLMHHTSGIPDYMNRNNSADQHATDTFLKVAHDFSEILSFLPQTLEFAPDTEFRYSNTNYFILDKVLETATRLSDQDLLKNELISPLGLPDTGSIEQWDSTVQGSTSIYPSNMEGVGNVYSTSSDLMTFMKALDGTQLLPQAWVAKMFESDPACQGANCERYGLGFRLPNPSDIDGHDWVYHQGHLNTVSSLIAKVPDLQLNMTVVSDRKEFDSETLAKQYFTSLIQSGCAAQRRP